VHLLEGLLWDDEFRHRRMDRGITAMAYAAMDERSRKVPCPPPLERWQDDPRWGVTQRVVGSRQFAKSPLLSKFLLHIVAEILAGHQEEITEHQIGVKVFGRPPGYLTVEDNIVRNYARQLRRRLAEYFADQGHSESLRIEIPLGGYVPVFSSASEVPVTQEAPEGVAAAVASASVPPPVAPHAPADEQASSKWNRKRLVRRLSVLAIYGVAAVALTWIAVRSGHWARPAHDPAQPLWAALFGGPANCYIVPADAGFNLLEDLSGHPLPLADYINGGYLELPLARVDSHSADDLRSQHFTSFVDLQIVSALARRPEFDPQRVILRFPRDLTLDDLKNSNAVIIGSVGSNPWAAIANDTSNFQIVYRKDMQGATMINVKPQPGEQASFVSHWNESAHETFATISFLPNLSASGHLLLLQGLDVAGTQAAAEMLLRPDRLAPVLRSAARRDGSLRSFEVLLRSTSIQSNAAGVEVVAFRVH
jgi:hypothetical protein